MANDRIFALDIGTRKIVGLVMEKAAGTYRVLDAEMVEHKTRAMLDGQIHDVETIAQNIKFIKEVLEKRLKTKLNEVAVAAAGRALRTSTANVKKKRRLLSEITSEEITALEIEAVQQAQVNLTSKDNLTKDKNHYICAGYSVANYALEGQNLANLVGHVGTEIELKIIATFLPRVVIDSLFSALKRAELKVYSMTLEPIAALSLAIPENMRLLNLALVDIGAGTSDIALIKDKSIFGYAMVPSGGDKLTETIATSFLIDFSRAETVKKQAKDMEVIRFKDILDNEIEHSNEEINGAIFPAVTELAGKIAEAIFDLNTKAPDAVICVGGGSLSANLIAVIAEKLNLLPQRVGIKSAATLDLIEFKHEFLQGPQGVTPLGIAYNAFIIPPLPFCRVKVNSREVTLWSTRNLDVGIALLNSGIAISNILGKPGLGKTIKVNGKMKSFKGGMGTPPTIKVNNRKADLESLIKDGDEIVFERGKDGNDAQVTWKDIVPAAGGWVRVNGDKVQLKPLVYVNGCLLESIDMEQAVEDRAQIEFTVINSVINVLALASAPVGALQNRDIKYSINGKKKSLKWSPLSVSCNSEPVDFDHQVNEGDELEYSVTRLFPTIKEVINTLPRQFIRIMVNDEPLEIEANNMNIFMNGELADPQDELINGAALIIKESANSVILSDIFRSYKVPNDIKGTMQIQIDGQPGGFTTPLQANSIVEIRWEN